MHCLLIVPKGFVQRDYFYEWNTNLSKPECECSNFVFTKLSIMGIT